MRAAWARACCFACQRAAWQTDRAAWGPTCCLVISARSRVRHRVGAKTTKQHAVYYAGSRRGNEDYTDPSSKLRAASTPTCCFSFFAPTWCRRLDGPEMTKQHSQRAACPSSMQITKQHSGTWPDGKLDSAETSGGRAAAWSELNFRGLSCCFDFACCFNSACCLDNRSFLYRVCVC